MISTAMKIISFERYWRRYGRETRFEYLIRAGSVENYSNFKCKQYYSLIIFPPGMGSLRFLRRFFQFILLAKGWQDNVRDDRPIYDWTERIGNSSAYCWHFPNWKKVTITIVTIRTLLWNQQVKSKINYPGRCRDIYSRK